MNNEEIINNLMNSTVKVLNIYEEIENLYKANSIVTLDYMDKVSELQKAIKEEKEIYQEIAIENLIKIFLKLDKINDKIMQQSENVMLTYARVIINIKNIVENDENTKKLFQNNPKIIYLKYLENDIHIVELQLLEELIQETKDKQIKNELINTKYMCQLFLNPSVEEILINNNFKTDNLYLQSNIVLNLLSNSNSVEKEVSNEITNKIKSHIKEILNITNQEYNNNENIVHSYITQTFLRALFAFKNEDELEDLNIYFHDLIDSKEYKQTHPENNISEEYVAKCFRKIKR